MKHWWFWLLIVILWMPLSAWAQEVSPAQAEAMKCEEDVRFLKRHTSIVATERDQHLRRIEFLELQMAALRQQMRQMKEAKVEAPAK